VSSDAGGVFQLGFFKSWVAWRRPRATAREEALPISALLACVRKLIPHHQDRHYDEIVRGFGIGELRPPTSPMSDDELSQAIADFLKDAPSSEAVSNLGRRFNPSSGV
jgi:hypothetical protein